MRADVDPLERVGPPWWYGISDGHADLNEIVRRLVDHGVLVRVLQGEAMRTLDGLFDEVSTVLDFPDYFGRNWDALDECLADLAWLSGSAYVLVVSNALAVLADECPHQFEVFLKILERVAAEWAEPVAVGAQWDRLAVPFHVVWHEVSGHVDELRDRFARVGRALDPLASFS